MILEGAAALLPKLQTYTGSSGSGGAATVGTFAPAVNTSGYPALPGNTSSLFAQGRLVRDMGKTLVSAGRSFRKIQGVAPTTNNSSPTFGVNGPLAGAALTGDIGYLTFYVETGREGANAASCPALVRFM